MVSDVLSGGTAAIRSYRNDSSARACVSAFQIVEVGREMDGVVFYSAEIASSNAVWSTGAGLTNILGEWVNGGGNTIKIVNNAVPASLVFDESVTAEAGIYANVHVRQDFIRTQGQHRGAELRRVPFQRAMP